MGAPRLSAGIVYDTLQAICAENGATLDDLEPAVFTEAIESLAHVARAVAESRSRQ